MEIVFVLIPLSLLLICLAVLIFRWAVKSGQYDDLDGPAYSILYDDDKDMIPKEARYQDQNTQEEEMKKNTKGDQ